MANARQVIEMQLFTDVLFGILFSGIVSASAYQKRSLSLSGVWGAMFLGTIIYAFGSLYWFGLLLAFFVSSSLLSHYKKERKKAAEDLFAKTGRRDIFQVTANGGLGALLVLFAYEAESPIPFMITYLGLMATANADTWATELGVLSKRPPVHILTWKKVAKGTSGGISFAGTAASLGGALFIGTCGAVFLLMEGFALKWEWVLLAGLAGWVGAWTDSLLGATVQRMNVCTVCQKEVETNVHCTQKTKAIRGYAWCTNDAVNLISSAAGGATAWLIWRIFFS